MKRTSLSVEEARRVVLAAQGFGLPREGEVTRARALATIARLGVLQLDSVNVLVRSHYLPLFSRLGVYRRSLLEELAYGKRAALFEYWGHEASLMPLALYPLFEWRRERARSGVGTWGSVAKVAHEQRALVERIEREIEARGPLSAGALEGYERGAGSWWGWSDHKRALEYLFWTGRLAAASRRHFERVYDLAERVIPARYRRLTLDDAAQQRELIALSARALGIASERDLRDYFRLPVADARRCIAELCEAGTLLRVAVEGVNGPMYLPAGARVPRAVAATALLSPFDSLVWQRQRTEQLFGFHYRLEIYTPAHKRVHGYYVLPFLLDGKLVARLDLKSDRENNTLVVRGLSLEAGIRRSAIAAPLRGELARLAAFLGLERVQQPR